MPAKTLTIGDREVARIGLGTNRLTNTPENVEFAAGAVAAGIDHIDTAHLYTEGESEQTLGAALPGARDDVLIATKGGFRDGRPEKLRAEFEESLRRLRTEVIDLYYLHRVDSEVPLEASLGVLEELRQEGRIRNVGISEVGIEEIERARQVLPIAVVQNRYNLAERGHDEVVDHCAREGIAFVAYFPLRPEPPPAVPEIAARHDATPEQVTLAWLLRRSPAMAVIPGTLSLEHLRENLAALDLELSDAEFDAITS